MSEEKSDTKPAKTNITDLDAAIAAAKKSKKAKDEAKASAPAEDKPAAAKAPKAKAEKPAKAPKAEKPAKPAKEPKSVDARLEKAESTLPTLSDRAHTAFRLVVDGVPPYTTAELLALSAHFGFEARKQALGAAISHGKPVKGSHVVIESGTGGAAKYIGMHGVVVEARNVRCFVDVKDDSGKTVKKALYLYTSDVTTCEAPAAAEPAAEEAAADTQPAPETQPAASETESAEATAA